CRKPLFRARLRRGQASDQENRETRVCDLRETRRLSYFSPVHEPVVSGIGLDNQRELKKATSAARSSRGKFLNASREALASPPCHRIASEKLRARPSCRNAFAPFTSSDSPIPHNGGVRQSATPAM